MLPDATDSFQVTSLAESIGASVQSLIDTEAADVSPPIRLTASIGIAVFPDHASEPDELWRSAEAALRAAKSAGGGALRIALVAADSAGSETPSVI